MAQRILVPPGEYDDWAVLLFLATLSGITGPPQAHLQGRAREPNNLRCTADEKRASV